jgi:hypothetical protein
LRRTSRPQRPERRALFSVTCAVDGRAHAVADEALADPRSRRAGRFRALCGYLVTAAPMVEPDGAPCPSCTGT